MGPATSILGVHLAAGVAWLAPVSETGDLRSGRPDRLEVGAGVSAARGLAEFEESFEHLLRTSDVDHVAILKPGSSRRAPRPLVSIQRGRLEGAMLIASSRASAEVFEVSHQAVEKLIGVRPTDDSFSTLIAEQLSGSAPTRWAERSPAYGAALTILADLS